MAGFLQIGEVATQTGLTVDAIRFYEREGLLRTAARSNGGFRLFSRPEVADLAFIRNARELGFSLQEIRELIGLRSMAHPNCQQVEDLLETKIGLVRERIASLRKLERDLQQAMTSCESNLRDAPHGQAEDCPVLSNIAEPKRKKKR